MIALHDLLCAASDAQRPVCRDDRAGSANAIITHAALVLPLTTSGMTLASATRKFRTPTTRRRGSTTAPIRHVLVRW